MSLAQARHMWELGPQTSLEVHSLPLRQLPLMQLPPTQRWLRPKSFTQAASSGQLVQV